MLGVRKGEEQIYEGEGDVGDLGATPGDLVIVFETQEDPFFKREGDDVIVDFLITFAQASLGTTVHIPSLYGMVGIFTFLFVISVQTPYYPLLFPFYSPFPLSMTPPLLPLLNLFSLFSCEHLYGFKVFFFFFESFKILVYHQVRNLMIYYK